MLIPFDDYPVHQTALPLAHAGAGGADHYDRLWFNGFRDDLMFGVAFCHYPNRTLMDGAFSVLRAGRQTSLFVSGRANPNPVDTRMGPMRIEIVEPMRVNRVLVDDPEHGISADLTYTATTPAFEEVRQNWRTGSRTTMDSTRATQWGQWTGTIDLDGETIDLGDDTFATKDRSWGQRTTPGNAVGAPLPPQPFLFLWSPIHFEDHCFHFLVFENPDGSQWAHDAVLVPKNDSSGAPAKLARVEHDIQWTPGQRWSRSATLTAHLLDGGSETLELRPLSRFQMKGLGYAHPRWGHGRWHDELAVGVERIDTDALEPLAPENLHVQQLVRATWRGQTGLGVLEQIILGPHERYGFREFLDGAGAAR
ncbi:hypothetical protein AB0H76_11685 [Nocardia sp. NPDC050712]|uniref:hypothetical protein n=1 Tax=Nocardia sp. NPDC050712 TaxID=3155518 RepID=UPI003411091B